MDNAKMHIVIAWTERDSVYDPKRHGPVERITPYAATWLLAGTEADLAAARTEVASKPNGRVYTFDRPTELSVARERIMCDMECFETWPDLLAHIASGGRVRYQAPLDARPASVIIGRVFKNGKVRVVPLSNRADPFNADPAHLPRFRKGA